MVSASPAPTITSSPAWATMSIRAIGSEQDVGLSRADSRRRGGRDRRRRRGVVVLVRLRVGSRPPDPDLGGFGITLQSPTSGMPSGAVKLMLFSPLVIVVTPFSVVVV